MVVEKVVTGHGVLRVVVGNIGRLMAVMVVCGSGAVDVQGCCDV